MRQMFSLSFQLKIYKMKNEWFRTIKFSNDTYLFKLLKNIIRQTWRHMPVFSSTQEAKAQGSQV